MHKLVKMVILFISGVFLLEYSANGQHLIIGQLLDKNSEAIVSCSVLLYDMENTNSLHAFDITDKNGHFFIKTTTLDSAMLIVRSMTHQELDTVLYFGATDSINVDFILKDKINEFEEIVIEAKASAFEMRGDTIFYHFKNYIDDPDESLETLINRLPGMSLDKSSGKIKFNGNDISYLLVDGDNLSGKSPQQVLQLIQSKDIEGIQTLQSYHENPLYKGFKSDQIAINVQLKDSLIIKKDISFHSGLLDDNRLLGGVSPDFVFMKKKRKLVISSGLHNTGNDLTRSSFGLNPKHTVSTSELFETNYAINRPINPSFEQRQYVLNDQVFSKIQYLDNRNEKRVFRITANYFRINEEVNTSSIEQFFFDDVSVNRIELNNNFNSLINELDIHSSVNFTHNERANSEFSIKFNSFNTESRFSSIQSDISDGVNNIEYNGNALSAKYNYFFKPAEKSMISFITKAEYLNSNQSGIYSNTLANLPLELSSDQELNQDKKVIKSQFEWKKNSNNGEINLGISSFLMREGFQNTINRSSILSDLSSVNFFGNNNQIATSAIKQYLAYIISFDKFDIKAEQSLQLQRYTINDELTKLELNSSQLLPSFSLVFDQKKYQFNRWNLSLTQSYKAPNFVSQNPGAVLVSNRTINIGLPSAKFIQERSIQLRNGYSGKNVEDANGFYQFRFSVDDRSALLTQSIDALNSVNQFSYINRPSTLLFGLYQRVKKSYLLKTNFEFSGALIRNEFFSNVNDDDIQRTTLSTFSPKLSTQTALFQRVSLKLDANFTFSQITGEEIGSSKISSMLMNSALQFKIQKSVSLKLEHRFIQADLSQRSAFNMYGLALRYKAVNQPLNVNLLLNNLTNTQYFETLNFGAFVQNTQRLHVTPFSMLLTAKYRFK